MSLHLPSSQLLRSLRPTINTSPSCRASFLIPIVHHQRRQRRTIFGGLFGRGDKSAPKVENPLTEEYLKRKPAANRQPPERGSLASSSIFEDDEPPSSSSASRRRRRLPTAAAVGARDPAAMAAVLDPQPRARRRWERKMVIAALRRRGRLSRAEHRRRTERELLSRSHNLATSVKKLMPLARQIAGKPLDEAIVQMRFSRKKAALEVRRHLEHARNEAVVRRGMGLGADAAVAASGADGADGVAAEVVGPLRIMTKDGKRMTVRDTSDIYIDQAWVGKGQFRGFELDHRARGKIHLIKNPSTSISVVLKEEATRIRQHNERQEKLKRKKVWTQLPNRPITMQHQYCLW